MDRYVPAAPGPREQAQRVTHIVGVIASSIVMAYGTGPQYEGIPLLGLVGYGVAAVLGLAWAVAILRSGRL